MDNSTPKHLTVVTEDVLMILNNTEVIAVDQDVLGHAAIKVGQSESEYNINAEVYWKILQPVIANGELSANAVLLFNPSNVTLSNIGLQFNEIGVNEECQVRDLWKHEDLDTMKNFTTSIPSHGAVLLRLSRV